MTELYYKRMFPNSYYKVSESLTLNEPQRLGRWSGRTQLPSLIPLLTAFSYVAYLKKCVRHFSLTLFNELIQQN